MGSLPLLPLSYKTSLANGTLTKFPSFTQHYHSRRRCSVTHFCLFFYFNFLYKSFISKGCFKLEYKVQIKFTPCVLSRIPKGVLAWRACGCDDGLLLYTMAPLAWILILLLCTELHTLYYQPPTKLSITHYVWWKPSPNPQKKNSHPSFKKPTLFLLIAYLSEIWLRFLLN